MPISAEEIGSVSFDPDLNEAVSVCAQVLGSLFSLDPITNEGDALVNEIAHLDCMREWPLGEPPALEQAQELIHAGTQTDDDSLREEYKRQFIGPGHFEAPQWASVYLDPDEIVFGCAHLELRQWMRQNGIEAQEDPSEGRVPCDSAGRELLLLAWLSQNRPELVNTFISMHLAPWFPRYLELLEGSSRQAFWQGVAILARTTLEAVIHELGIDIEQRKLYH
mgnify:FL=1